MMLTAVTAVTTVTANVTANVTALLPGAQCTERETRRVGQEGAGISI